MKTIARPDWVTDEMLALRNADASPSRVSQVRASTSPGARVEQSRSARPRTSSSCKTCKSQRLKRLESIERGQRLERIGGTESERRRRRLAQIGK